VSDQHPRYVARELRGWAILPGGVRGNGSTTFTLLDSWYGYAVVMLRESGVSRPPAKLRRQFARAARYMNTVRVCQRVGCETEVPRKPTDTGYRTLARYCSSRCREKAKYRRQRAAGIK
jgi:hypothetical protein